MSTGQRDSNDEQWRIIGCGRKRNTYYYCTGGWNNHRTGLREIRPSIGAELNGCTSEAVPLSVNREAHGHLGKERLRRVEINIEISRAIRPAPSETQCKKGRVGVARKLVLRSL